MLKKEKKYVFVYKNIKLNIFTIKKSLIYSQIFKNKYINLFLLDISLTFFQKSIKYRPLDS